MKRILILHYISITSLIALIFLVVAWEGFLAPLKPGGSMMILKVLPLLLPLFGILRGKRYTYQWASMLILIYFTEGAVRAWSDQGMSALLAGGEVILSVVFFISTIYYARDTGRLRHDGTIAHDNKPAP